MQHEENKDITILFSLLLDSANQSLGSKEDDLDQTDKGESHAEAKHSSDVGDERRGRHHLKKENYIEKVCLFYLVSLKLREVWRVEKGIDLDHVFRGVQHQLLLESLENCVIHIQLLIELERRYIPILHIFHHIVINNVKKRA